MFVVRSHSQTAVRASMITSGTETDVMYHQEKNRGDSSLKGISNRKERHFTKEGKSGKSDKKKKKKKVERRPSNCVFVRGEDRKVSWLKRQTFENGDIYGIQVHGRGREGKGKDRWYNMGRMCDDAW